MTGPAIALVELEGMLLKTLKDAWRERADVRSLPAKDVLQELARDPPDLIVVPEQLSKGSGFALVNRLRRMEALGPSKLMLISGDGNQAALDHHQVGPTPAHAYVLGPLERSDSRFAELILEAAGRLVPELAPPEPSLLPEVDDDDVEELAPGAPAPDALQDALAGVMERLGGYRVLRRLRDEDGGAVFACMDEELDRPVAVKILPPQGKPDDNESMQRFLRERQVLAVVNSPHVLRVYGAGTHEGCPYLVRELVVGESLQEMIAQGPLDIDDALTWARETAVALMQAYDAGVVHRDVCPANIYIDDGHVKLARFGAGRFVSAREHQITLMGMRVINQQYAAPERVMGGGDDKSDIYSLGATLHALIAGRPPYASSRPVDMVTGRLTEEPMPLAEAREGVPKGVADLVARMMCADVAGRPRDWREVVSALDELRAPAAASRGAAEGATPDGPPRDEEPSGIRGTLRRMGVVDLVQTLEMSRKTATVTLHGPDGEGVLAFKQGWLVHAAWRGELGEAAFFALVDVTEGSFSVGFGDVTLDQNVHRPTTGLLLEALRLRDEAAPAPAPSAADAFSASNASSASHSLPPPGPGDSGGQSAWFDRAPANDPAKAHRAGGGAMGEDPDLNDDDEALGLPSWTSRQVHSWLGYVAIVVVASLAGWGGTRLPSFPPAPEVEDLSMYGELFDAQRRRIRRLTDELARAKPALVAATAEDEAAKKQADVVAAVSKHLGEVLAPDVKDGRVRVRAEAGASELVVELPDAAVFGGQTAAITVEGEALLGRVSTALKALRYLEVRIEAHSDDRAPPEASGHTTNWSLTGAQAAEVLGAFRKLGWPQRELSYAARAEVAPLLSNAGPRGRARNRRIELVITPSPKLLDQPLVAPAEAGAGEVPGGKTADGHPSK